MKEEFAARINDWIGRHEEVTDELVNEIVYALAMDLELSDDFFRHVRSKRNQYSWERAAID